MGGWGGWAAVSTDAHTFEVPLDGDGAGVIRVRIREADERAAP